MENETIPNEMGGDIIFQCVAYDQSLITKCFLGDLKLPNPVLPSMVR